MKYLIPGLAVLAGLMFTPWRAAAGMFELSGGFSFNRSNYSNANYEWSRHWGLNFGYHFTERSEIEFSFQDVFNRTSITGYEDTTFHDQIYGVNWVQALTGKDFPIQPYFKVGIGQLNRDASGSYALGVAPPAQLDEVTGILGAGLKIYLAHGLGLRVEGTTYLAGGVLSTWQDNFAFTTGLSLYF